MNKYGGVSYSFARGNDFGLHSLGGGFITPSSTSTSTFYELIC